MKTNNTNNNKEKIFLLLNSFLLNRLEKTLELIYVQEIIKFF